MDKRSGAAYFGFLPFRQGRGRGKRKKREEEKDEEDEQEKNKESLLCPLRVRFGCTSSLSEGAKQRIRSRRLSRQCFNHDSLR